MRAGFILLLVLHGLIHLMGFAKAFGYAELPQLQLPISKGMGVLWLVAGVAVIGAAVLLAVAPRAWGMVAIVAALLSQIVIVSAWSDARFGTLANILLFAAGVYGFVAQGPFSFEAEYRRAIAAHPTPSVAAPLVIEADLHPLPDPIQRYLHAVGVTGQPAIRSVRVVWQGRIRGAPDDPWMPFTAEQVNFIDDDSRYFHLRASKRGVPVDVLHRFEGGIASMRVRLLSLFPLVDARGPEMNRAETVTIFNDIALLAPSGLANPRIRWEALDDRSARGFLTIGAHTVSAVLVVDDAGDLVDFISDDRLLASPDGKTFTPTRWSTPITGYRAFGGRRVMHGGAGVWHAASGSYPYIELEVVDYRVNE